MNSSLVEDLRRQFEICSQLLGLVEQEGRALRSGEDLRRREFLAARQRLLPELERCVATLKNRRREWEALAEAERSQEREAQALLRQGQDLILKIIVQDRENEQALLRHGLVPPRQLPAAERQRPHFVADLYRRQSGSAPRAPGPPPTR
jgi:flagellar biosynthesis/type III secretory pathway chaperone